MTHSYESHSGRYWVRVWCLVIGLLVVAAAPGILPTSSSPLPFQIMIAVIAVIAFFVCAYVRPKRLEVTISDTDVVIRGGAGRVEYSSSLGQLNSLSLGRWGHVLGFPIGWIAIKAAASGKVRYVGAISGYRFTAEMFTDLEEDFLDAKNVVEQVAASDR